MTTLTVFVGLLALVGVLLLALILYQFHRSLQRLSEALDAQNSKRSAWEEVLGSFMQIHETIGGLKSKLESLNTDISNLRGIFDNPALRGHLGEVQLEELIRSILPQGLWKRQYQFSDGTTVDVVIEVGAGEDKLLIPVDAKFPLEVVSRWENNPQEARKRLAESVKRKVDEVSKYVRTAERTTDWAFMFVPSDRIYHEILANGDGLWEYALKKRVVLVSPSVFYAYLNTVRLGLRGLQLEANARQILGLVSQVRQDLERLEKALDTLARHVNNASGKISEAKDYVNLLKIRMERLDVPADS